MSPKLLNILLIISSAIMYFYVIKPLYAGGDTGLWNPGDNNIKSLISKKASYDITNKKVDDLIKEAKNIQEQYDSFDEAIKQQMLVMVPSSVDSIKLLSEMTKIATDNGFQLDGLGIKDVGNGEYTVSFSVFTTYKQFKEYIKFYETSMRLLSLQSVSFSPSKDENDQTKFSVVFTTYYLK